MRPSQPKYLFKMAIHNIVMVIIESFYFTAIALGYFFHNQVKILNLMIVLLVKIVLRIFTVISKWNRDKSGLIATVLDIIKFITLIIQIVNELIVIVIIIIEKQFHRYELYLVIFSLVYSLILPLVFIIFLKIKYYCHAEEITINRSKEEIINDYIIKQTLKKQKNVK
ncbi:Transmembrane domain-containing protein [Spironucleus salmonicida]|uniref:Transmembrane domain-containing protein n=1 Tax=Spironucleus salmonicida TaxID=348837 RepID=A0A9P8LUV6_9EUKA|nr:Transmembrane domain-containing protein [Spironucleus salmonicida]